MLRQSAYLGDYTTLTTTKFGQKIFLDTRDVSIAPHILLDGDWEAWITDGVMRLLGPVGAADKARPPTFIDVGANVGWYSLLAARFGFKVLAFEANHGLAQLLTRSLAVNGYGNTKVLPIAASDEHGVVQMRINPYNAGGSHIVGSAAMEEREDPMARMALAATPTEVKCGPIHDYVDDEEEVTMMKIDVEGHEPEAIRGASRVIDRNPRIMLAIEHNSGDGPLMKDLAERGFGFRYFATDGNQPAVAVEQIDELPPATMILAQRVTA